MLINQRLEKLTTAWVHFTLQGMLNSPTWQPRLPHLIPSDNDNDQSGAVHEDAIHNKVFLAQTHSVPETTFFNIPPNSLDDSVELGSLTCISMHLMAALRKWHR